MVLTQHASDLVRRHGVPMSFHPIRPTRSDVVSALRCSFHSSDLVRRRFCQVCLYPQPPWSDVIIAYEFSFLTSDLVRRKFSSLCPLNCLFRAVFEFS